MQDIWIISGANLNLLGVREPHIYGATTLKEIETNLQNKCQNRARLTCFQSNNEGDLIDFLQSVHFGKHCDGVIINPAGFTHTSVVLRDALVAMDVPFVEVHLSNIHAREPFRAHSYFSDKAQGVICGLGASGYGYALDFLLMHLSTQAD